jgi:hypothetical protein
MRAEDNKPSLDVQSQGSNQFSAMGLFLEICSLGENYSSYHFQGEMAKEVWTTSQRRGTTAAEKRKARIVADYWFNGGNFFPPRWRTLDGQLNLGEQCILWGL